MAPGEDRSASEHLQESLDLFTSLGDSVGQGNAGYALAIALRRLGDYEGARAEHEAALAVLREIGDRRGEAAALNNLGMVLMVRGEHDGAGLLFAEALECHLDLGQPIGAAVAWDNLGSLANRRGRHDEALACHTTALSEFVRWATRRGRGRSRRGIGVALAGLGRAYEALEELAHAVEIGAADRGGADVEMNAWCELGRVLLTDRSSGTRARRCVHPGGAAGGPGSATVCLLATAEGRPRRRARVPRATSRRAQVGTRAGRGRAFEAMGTCPCPADPHVATVVLTVDAETGGIRRG